MSSNTAWVTLATNDSYSLGALVLAHSLKTAKTVHKLAILITPGVTTSMKQQIETVFDDVKVVDVLDSKDQTHLALMSRPELGVTFTKLHCWTLINYEKCVFLDADTLVLQNCDELFEREELSAAPDPGWPDCFNSGVFVFKPSLETFEELLEFARKRGSFDGGDQGLLNMYFKEWARTDISKHLSFTYNVVWSSTYSYLPALKQFGQNMKIVHFIASSKPWLQSFNTETKVVTPISGGTGLQPLLQFWWDLFCQHVHPSLSTEMIESRLSSRYSYDFHPEIRPIINTPNYYTPNRNNIFSCNAPTYEPPKQSPYNFIDPWEKYFDIDIENDYEVTEEKASVSQVENARGDGNLMEVYLNNVVEESNTSENNEKDNEHFENVTELNEPNQEEHNPLVIDVYPACYDDIPINPNSSLSVINCHPDSPTHCEVPKDQTCDIDGGLAGQFARVSLGEKTDAQKALEDFLRRQSWEQGNMDYLGKDSFLNIWAKINETLGKVTEVVTEPSVVRAPSPPEVFHSKEPKPLKSALKKSSTTIPPVESELQTESSELPVKQLEKLDLSKNILKELKTPDTPTVTSPTPPTTPATQVLESPKAESVEETPKSVVCTKEISKSEEQELPKSDVTKPVKVVLESDVSSKLEGTIPKSESSVEKPDELKKEISPPTETPLPVDNTLPSISNDPPVAPKRTNKGAKPSEKK